jgi:hypothetical protein
VDEADGALSEGTARKGEADEEEVDEGESKGSNASATAAAGGGLAGSKRDAEGEAAELKDPVSQAALRLKDVPYSEARRAFLHCKLLERVEKKDVTSTPLHVFYGLGRGWYVACDEHGRCQPHVDARPQLP